MTQGIAADQLHSIIARIEVVTEEKDLLTANIREIYAEAKANGFDTKAMRQIVRLRKLSKTERQEQVALVDLYAHALGMLEE